MKGKRKVWIGVLIVIVIIIAIALKPHKKSAIANKGYEFAEVKKGDVQNVISCTGVLQAKGSVDVGSQISGTVDKVLVDFNDYVKKGQVMAIIDTTQLHLSAQISRADLMRAEAELKTAKIDYLNSKALYEKKMVSEDTYLKAERDFRLATASLLTAKANYEKNDNNLRIYSVIRAPINGIVINRSVEAGQTIAASLSAPTLFTIANDLSKMEIKASVDESDIGSIKNKMAVNFTVDAFDEKEYTGYVKQIRLQPETTSNVVNYSVIIEAMNPDKTLLPGMTATVDFLLDKQYNVLKVSNKALKYKPDSDVSMAVMMKKRAEMRKKFMKMKESGDTTAINQFRKRRGHRNAGGQAFGMMGGGAGQGTSKVNRTALWYLNDKGELDMMYVETGATDGSYTEIKGREVQAGLQCIVKAPEMKMKSGSIFSPGPPRRGMH